MWPGILFLYIFRGSEVVSESGDADFPENGDGCVLECLGQSEEDDPQDSFGRGRNGEKHLGEGDGIT